MSSPSGLRSIMDDIAVTTSAVPSSGGEWLNLGVGNPAQIPDVIQYWRSVTLDMVSERFETTCASYGPSRGSSALIGALVDYFAGRYGWDIGPQNVVITPGSQTLLFLAAALFTGPGRGVDRPLVLPMTPDYTGYQGVAIHRGGIMGVPGDVEITSDHTFEYQPNFDRLSALPQAGMLLTSSPCNPTGRSYGPDELVGLRSVAEQSDVPLVLDNAYGPPFPMMLDSAQPPIQHPHVIHCFSASKAGLPGARVGIAIGDERYISPLVAAVSNSVLHGPQLEQAVLARAISSRGIDGLVSEHIRPFYAERREWARAKIQSIFPSSMAWRLHTSEGGMFSWIWIDEPWFEDLKFYARMKRKGVFVVPGRHFFVSELLAGHDTRCFRISLSARVDEIEEGLGRIAEALQEMESASCKGHADDRHGCGPPQVGSGCPLQ